MVPSGDGQISAGSGSSSLRLNGSPVSSRVFTRSAHIRSNHHSWDGKPEYLWENEAFSWASNFFRERGIKVPQRTVEYERSLIAEKVERL